MRNHSGIIAAAGQVWTPDSLSSLAAWLAPTDATLPAAYPSGLPSGEYWDFATGVTGDPVSNWAGTHTLGLEWTQATSDRRPDLTVDGLVFDGSNDEMYSTTTPAHADDFVIMIRYKIPAIVNFAVFIGRYDPDTDNRSWQFGIIGTDTALSLSANGTSVTSYVIDDITTGRWESVVIKKSGDTVRRWVNGSMSTVTTGASATLHNVGSFPLNLGANGATASIAGAGHQAMTVSHAGYFPGAHSDDWCESVSRELGALGAFSGPSWGPANALTGPYTTLPSQSDVRVYQPSGSTPTSGNYLTAGRYVHHTRIFARSESILHLMYSIGLENEDGGGQSSAIRISTDGGATWGAAEVLIPPQATMTTPSGGRITYPTAFVEYSGTLYACVAVHDFDDITFKRLGIMFAARSVAADGTLGTLFRVTPDSYTPQGGAADIVYDGTLGPPILTELKIHAHWGGDDPNENGQTWSTNYYTVSPAVQLNERSAIPDPVLAGKYLATYKRKTGLTVNLIAWARLDSTGVPEFGPLASTIPDSPSASHMGVLADGRFILNHNPQDTGGVVRDPLTLGISDPNRRTFAHVFAVRQGLSDTPVYSGTFKIGGAAYAHAAESPDGKTLWVSYSTQKEEIWVTKLAIPKQIGSLADSVAGTWAHTDYSYAARPHKVRPLSLSTEFIWFDGTASHFDKSTSLPTGTAGALVFAVRPQRVTGTQYLIALADTGTSNNLWGMRLNGTSLEVVSQAGGTANVVRATTTTFAIDTTYVITVESNGTAWSIRVNGVAETISVQSGSNTGDWCGDVSGPDVVSLGALVTTSTGSFYLGYLGDLLLTSAAVSSGDRSSAETWVAEHNGVTL